MPIIDSKSGKIIKEYSILELRDAAKLIRSLSITAIAAAGSGHTGGVMSVIDIATALYLKTIRHDPNNPDWPDRDRVFWSAGHKAPALYATLGICGYFDYKDVVKLRKLYSGFEGHPNRLKLPGVELSSGSLGQGLGVAVGSALNARLENKDYKTYCIMGDGELNEGSVWEALMSVSHYKLDNLIAIIDRNGLQIDGRTSEVMEIEPLVDKLEAFGWCTVEIDGHNIQEILKALDEIPRVYGKPTAIIAHTLKGKCISYAEDVCGYHGISPKNGIYGDESLEVALRDINCSNFTKETTESLLKIAEDYQKEVDKKVEDILPKFSKNYWWNTSNNTNVDMEPTRFGFGKAIKELGEDTRIVALGADITDSIKMSEFYKSNPERRPRFFSMGIAEQNMTVVAAGLAKEGKIPFIGSYGVFVSGRNWDQLRTTVCYNNFNVKIACAHAGISVGPDGATHQALEEISNLYYLPNMKIAVPCDSVETEKATKAITYINGPAAIIYTREATPVVTKNDTPYEFGIANIIRYRGRGDNFASSFDVTLSKDYKNEDENLSIIACGPVVTEAMRAAYIIKEEYNVESRIINIHTVKPIDKQAIINALTDTRLIITIEEHQVGGFGNIIAGVIGVNKCLNDLFKMYMVGIEDRFGVSGQTWELMKVFGLTAESIVEKALHLLKSN